MTRPGPSWVIEAAEDLPPVGPAERGDYLADEQRLVRELAARGVRVALAGSREEMLGPDEAVAAAVDFHDLVGSLDPQAAHFRYSCSRSRVNEITPRKAMATKNIATATRGKNDAAVPKSGWMMISPTGAGTVASVSRGTGPVFSILDRPAKGAK